MTEAFPPERIDTPAAWRAHDLRADEWLHTFSPDDVGDIEASAKALVERDANLSALTADDFPIPRFAARLCAILQNDVLRGRGFAVIRGLDPARLARVENAAAFLGIGAHLGAARPQNAAGHLLGHVKNVGRSAPTPRRACTRPTNGRPTTRIRPMWSPSCACSRQSGAAGRTW
jgi:hypothetical protein